MNAGTIFVGLFLTLLGVLFLRFPHEGQNFVSSQEWQDNPGRAKRKQKQISKGLGVFLVCGLGLPMTVWGVVV